MTVHSPSSSPSDCANRPEGAAWLRPGRSSVRLHSVLREPAGDGRLPLLEVRLLGEPPRRTQIPHQVFINTLLIAQLNCISQVGFKSITLKHAHIHALLFQKVFHTFMHISCVTIVYPLQRPVCGRSEEVQENSCRRSTQRTVPGSQPRPQQPFKPRPGLWLSVF